MRRHTARYVKPRKYWVLSGSDAEPEDVLQEISDRVAVRCSRTLSPLGQPREPGAAGSGVFSNQPRKHPACLDKQKSITPPKGSGSHAVHSEAILIGTSPEEIPRTVTTYWLVQLPNNPHVRHPQLI